MIFFYPKLAIYVKLYLLNGVNCIEKKKTKKKQNSLNPSFSETFTFQADYRGGVLKIEIWGVYGKLNRKTFMGIAQINLDDLDLSNDVDGWYSLWDFWSNMDNGSLFEDELMLGE